MTGARKTNITPITVTLSIDTQLANDPQFHYVRDHYVRIVALAQGGGHNSTVCGISHGIQNIERLQYNNRSRMVIIFINKLFG